jgi:hypothetical protein
MVALAPINNETPAWDVLDTFPKLHSRAREATTSTCTEVPSLKSRNCIEIWLTIYESCDGLESFTRDPIGYVDGGNLYSDYFKLSNTDPSGLRKVCCRFRIGFFIREFEVTEIDCPDWQGAGLCCRNHGDVWYRHFRFVDSFSGPCDHNPNPITCALAPQSTTVLVASSTLQCGKVVNTFNPVVVTSMVLMCAQSQIVKNDPNIGFPVGPEVKKGKWRCTAKARNWNKGTPCYDQIYEGEGKSESDAYTSAWQACVDAGCHQPGRGGDCGHVTCEQRP